MNFTKASNDQLSNIIANDMDIPTHLLSGVVSEMLNRNLLEGLVKRTVLKQFTHIKIAVSVLGMPEEDIFQFCRMKIFETVEKWKPGKSSFVFFSCLRVCSELKDLEGKAKANKRKVYENIQSIDSERNEKGESFAELLPTRTNVEKEVIQKLTLEEKMQLLTELEKRTLLLYMKGYSSTEIGQMMNKSRKATARQINNGLSKICGRKTSISELGMMNIGKGETA